MVIPIRTESVSRRTPTVNHALIAINVLCFLLFHAFPGEAVERFQRDHLDFLSHDPRLHQFITYQFLHGNLTHLLGNMLFLWVFGNSVNGKLGHAAYLMFYLSGGVFAALGYGLVTPEATHLVGASGAIAAVTTAYLALFPRSHVTVLVWLFFLIQFVQAPAMALILFKIIAWDNIIGPRMVGSQNVAHSAHLAGYLFGFAASLLLLWVRALPRDQFDILALWRRWSQRRELSRSLRDPVSAARARFGTVARVEPVDPRVQAAEDQRLDALSDLRARIVEALVRRDRPAAIELHGQLIDTDPRQCLDERFQLEIARALFDAGAVARAAAAFETFVQSYPRSTDAGDVMLLLGIIYARDLKQPEIARRVLSRALETLQDPQRRAQCERWLRESGAPPNSPASM